MTDTQRSIMTGKRPNSSTNARKSIVLRSCVVFLWGCLPLLGVLGWIIEGRANAEEEFAKPLENRSHGKKIEKEGMVPLDPEILPIMAHASPFYLYVAISSDDGDVATAHNTRFTAILIRRYCKKLGIIVRVESVDMKSPEIVSWNAYEENNSSMMFAVSIVRHNATILFQPAPQHGDQDTVRWVEKNNRVLTLSVQFRSSYMSLERALAYLGQLNYMAGLKRTIQRRMQWVLMHRMLEHLILRLGNKGYYFTLPLFDHPDDIEQVHVDTPAQSFDPNFLSPSRTPTLPNFDHATEKNPQQ